ncbi:MAG: CHAT domain-containing protein [Armatimonadetes bacterium]|nr:CHAT domain-containing protein [Armatimonadota bacterium]
MTSLAEAFSIAGTPTVVASLWSVEDQSTRDLMVSFYTGLGQGMSRGKALQRAEVEMLRTRPHPFYWAPFVILGDWR